MTPVAWGAFSGAGIGVGLLLAFARVRAIRRPSLAARVLPYVRDVPGIGAARHTVAVSKPGSSSPVTAVFGPLLRTAAEGVEQVLGGASSVKKRLVRAGSSATVHEFRIEQVVWGLIGFGVTAGYGLLTTLSGGGNVVPRAILSLLAFAGGIIARDSYLSQQVKARESRMLVEFPTVAELLALSVAAGESPVSALERVVQRTGGDLAHDLAGVLGEIRTGEPVGSAFDKYAREAGLPLVANFAQGIAVAMERGTPLADVLHAQSADVREAGRRELIETAARREVLMMVPVVFLVLPVTIVFAFWPGLVGLNLTTG